MIHLDHNHSSSIPGPAKPQNLILSNSPRTDQHRVLPWQSPSRDGGPFYRESQEQFLTEPPKPTAQPDQPSTDPSSSALPAAPGPISPADAENTARPEPSPSSPTDARSPPADSSSSLTPPPDATTPNNAMDAPDDPPGQPATNTGAGNTEKVSEQQTAADEVDRASRQSTPLSELSSAPETAPDDEAGAGDCPPGQVDGEGAASDATKNQSDGGGAKSSSDPPKSSSSAAAASISAKDNGPSLTRRQNPSHSSPRQTLASGVRPVSTASDQNMTGMDGMSSLKMAHGQSSFPDGTLSGHPPQPLVPQSRIPVHDPKVVSILELNSLLLRICMEFQARGVVMTDPSFNQYATRLQSNLTWLAAAADDNHKVSQSMLVLPVMQPPPPIDFSEMERVLQIYRDLPNIFAKEIARRHAATSGSMNGHAKRERTEEPGQDGMHKRRDTGETKPQIPTSFVTPGAGPSTPHPPSQAMQHGPNAMGSVSLSAGPVPRMGSPAMPPPPVPQVAISQNDAQIAAAARARQAQMRQMQQQHIEGSRQMSPPSGMPSGMGMGNVQNVAGPSSILNVPQLTHQQMASLSAMGPQAVQNYQALQTPGNQFVQLMVQQVPGFMQLPLQDKLQKMQYAQNVIRQRNAAQAQAAGSMGTSGGFPQGAMMPQHAGDGSPSRMSPVSQQSSMQPGFPQGASQSGDLRSMMTPQQQQMLANNPQQRQLYLMQQQMMRGGGVAGGMNPQMMNQQQIMQERMRLEQQQRMAQAQAQAQAAASGQGSPTNVMGSPMVDSPQFPALRSNPGMPGIARSARTPSDSNPSPVSQQRMSMSGQSSEDQQRAMMMQAQQRGMTPQQMQNFASGMSNPAYAAQLQQMGMGGGQNPNAFRMTSPPGSAGGQGGFGGTGRMPSPAGGNPGQMWTQSATGGGQYPGGGPFMAPSPSASQHDGMTPGRQTSATPAPHQQMGQNPSGDQAGLGDLDFFNWGQ